MVPPRARHSACSQGDRRALARAITLVAGRRAGGRRARPRDLPAHGATRLSSAVTGPPGAGKSTLIGALVARAASGSGDSIGVLSIDPTSPFTGGALLGDRIRLAEHFLDGGVFIRSMATRGALGGLASAALQAVLLMDAAGRDEIYVETVGVGQARDRHRRPRRHRRARAGARLGRLGPGAQGRRDGDPRRDRRQQGRSPARATALVRDIRGVLALAPAEVPAGSRPRHRRARRRRASRSSRRRSQAHRAALSGSGDARSAAPAQPAQRGDRARDARAGVRELERAARPATARFEALLDEVVARRLDPASAARALSEDAGA